MRSLLKFPTYTVQVLPFQVDIAASSFACRQFGEIYHVNPNASGSRTRKIPGSLRRSAPTWPSPVAPSPQTHPPHTIGRGRCCNKTNRPFQGGPRPWRLWTNKEWGRQSPTALQVRLKYQCLSSVGKTKYQSFSFVAIGKTKYQCLSSVGKTKYLCLISVGKTKCLSVFKLCR